MWRLSLKSRSQAGTSCTPPRLVTHVTGVVTAPRGGHYRSGNKCRGSRTTQTPNAPISTTCHTPLGNVERDERGTDVLIAALRDLQWRRRRFMIAAVGTALVLP